MNLQIQCPNCRKRFTVQEDLTGKTVECGACEHRFPVRSDSIIIEREKFYPGENKDEFLSRLGKSPSASENQKAPSERIQPVHLPQVDSIMPASPGQSIAVTTGITILSLFAMIFFFGTAPGQIFQDVALEQRFVLGGFVCVLGGGLIIFGAKNWRVKGFLLAVTLVSVAMALIVLRPVHVTPQIEANGEGVQMNVAPRDGDDGVRGLDDFLTEIDRKALEREIARQVEKLDGLAADNYVTGIYISDLRETQYQAIERYFRKKLSLPKSEALSFYKRNGDRDRFIVISGVPMDFDLMVRFCEFLGRTTSYPEERVLNVELSARHFQNPTVDLLDKLNNVENPAFFTQNLNELRNIDHERISEAVKRLGRVPEEVELKNRDQIIQELLLLASEETSPTILSDVGQALKVFGKNSRVAVEKINRLISHWLESEVSVARTMVEFLIENNDPDLFPLLDRLWVSAPSRWDEHYARLGSQIEERIIFHVQESPEALRRSAISILSKIGTQKSISALEASQRGEDQEARILAQRALQAIQSRLPQ